MKVAIVSGPDAGRAFPAAALSAGLAATGDEVLALTGASCIDRLTAQGVRAELLPGADTTLRYRHPDDAAAATAATVALLRDWEPDLLVADVKTPVGAFAAEILGLPWVQLHPHPIRFSTNAPGMGRHRGGLSWSRPESSRPDPDRRGRQALQAARSSLGLPAIGVLPQLDLVATLPALEPPRPDWPRRASVVGPLTFEPTDVELPIPSGKGPLVLISPPTSAPDGNLLRVSLRALRGLRIVATTLLPYEGEVPQWATVGTGRQGPLLAAAAVVVTGGGHGMIARALTAGVPLVLVPGNDDQLELSKAAAELGVAVVVRRRGERTLRRAVERVLSDVAMAAQARSVARAVATADPVVLCHQVFAGRSA